MCVRAIIAINRTEENVRTTIARGWQYNVTYKELNSFRNRMVLMKPVTGNFTGDDSAKKWMKTVGEKGMK